MYLFIYLFIYIYIHSFIYLSIYLFIYLFLHPFKATAVRESVLPAHPDSDTYFKNEEKVKKSENYDERSVRHNKRGEIKSEIRFGNNCIDNHNIHIDHNNKLYEGNVGDNNNSNCDNHNHNHNCDDNNFGNNSNNDNNNSNNDNSTEYDKINNLPFEKNILDNYKIIADIKDQDEYQDNDRISNRNEIVDENLYQHKDKYKNRNKNKNENENENENENLNEVENKSMNEDNVRYRDMNILLNICIDCDRAKTAQAAPGIGNNTQKRKNSTKLKL